MPELIKTGKIVIGQYADYFDTGIWTLDAKGRMVAPGDLSIRQLKDFLTACGGAVYLAEDGALCWFSIDREG